MLFAASNATDRGFRDGRNRADRSVQGRPPGALASASLRTGAGLFVDLRRSDCLFWAADHGHCRWMTRDHSVPAARLLRSVQRFSTCNGRRGRSLDRRGKTGISTRPAARIPARNVMSPHRLLITGSSAHQVHQPRCLSHRRSRSGCGVLGDVPIKRCASDAEVLGDAIARMTIGLHPARAQPAAARCCRRAGWSPMWGQNESGRERHTIGKVAVHGGAGDSQHLRDVGGRDALLPELAGFGGIGVVDLAWTPALASVGCGSEQPG